MDHAQPPTILSLCSGGGGLDIGLDLAIGGARTVCWVEWEAFAIEYLATCMEKGCLAAAPLWTDLRTFDGRPWRGVVDIVTAGYPCQPFSCAGRRRGSDDPRHLWPHVRRVIGEVQPPIVYLENVPGHLSLGFSQVACDLEAMGYRIAAGLFTAAEVSASHKRERLFILGVTDGLADTTGQHDGLRQRFGECPASTAGAESRTEDAGSAVADATHTMKGGGKHRGQGRESELLLPGQAEQFAASPLWKTPHGMSGVDASGKRGGPGGGEFGKQATRWGLEQWPTPDVPNGGRAVSAADMERGRTVTGRKIQRPLARVAEMLPFPSSHQDQPTPTPGTKSSPSKMDSPRLNPSFVSWLMGWPPSGNTVSSCSVTEWSRYRQRMRSALCGLLSAWDHRPATKPQPR